MAAWARRRAAQAGRVRLGAVGIVLCLVASSFMIAIAPLGQSASADPAGGTLPAGVRDGWCRPGEGVAVVVSVNTTDYKGPLPSQVDSQGNLKRCIYDTSALIQKTRDAYTQLKGISSSDYAYCSPSTYCGPHEFVEYAALSMVNVDFRMGTWYPLLGTSVGSSSSGDPNDTTQWDSLLGLTSTLGGALFWNFDLGWVDGQNTGHWCGDNPNSGFCYGVAYKNFLLTSQDLPNFFFSETYGDTAQHREPNIPPQYLAGPSDSPDPSPVSSDNKSTPAIDNGGGGSGGTDGQGAGNGGSGGAGGQGSGASGGDGAQAGGQAVPGVNASGAGTGTVQQPSGTATTAAGAAGTAAPSGVPTQGGMSASSSASASSTAATSHTATVSPTSSARSANAGRVWGSDASSQDPAAAAARVRPWAVAGVGALGIGVLAWAWLTVRRRRSVALSEGRETPTAGRIGSDRPDDEEPW